MPRTGIRMTWVARSLTAFFRNNKSSKNEKIFTSCNVRIGLERLSYDYLK